MDNFDFDYFFTNANNNFYLVLFFVLTFITYLIVKRVNRYLGRRSKLKEFATAYERKRDCRGNLAYHYYWQLNSGENTSARNTANDILELDDELNEMYEQYQQLKKNGVVDLKKI